MFVVLDGRCEVFFRHIMLLVPISAEMTVAKLYPSYFGIRALLGQKEPNSFSLFKISGLPFFSILRQKMSVCSAGSPT